MRMINLKNQITAYILGGVVILTAIFQIRKGGADAQKHKHTEATLENVAQAKQTHDDTVQQLNNPIERKWLRKKWKYPSE